MHAGADGTGLCARVGRVRREASNVTRMAEASEGQERVQQSQGRRACALNLSELAVESSVGRV